MADLMQRLELMADAYSQLGEKDLPLLLREAAAALRAAPEGPATHYHCAEGIYGTLSRLRRYAKQGDNKNTLQGQTMEEAAAFIEHALAVRPQGVKDAP